MDTQTEMNVPEAILTQMARRKDTIRRALPAAEIAVKSFTSALASTVDGLDAARRATLYGRADKFFSDAVDAATQRVMLLCVFSGGGDESRMYEAILEFMVMCGCQTHLRTAAANKDAREPTRLMPMGQKK